MFNELETRGPKFRKGSIEVVCGSMFSGKTEELIRRMKRAQFAKLKVEIFKPAIDVRYSEAEVVSHDRNAIQSTPVDSSPWYSRHLCRLGYGLQRRAIWSYASLDGYCRRCV